MKKIFCWMLVGAMIIFTISIVGCNSSNNNDVQDEVIITKDNFEEYFSVSVEFCTMYFCSSRTGSLPRGRGA